MAILFAFYVLIEFHYLRLLVFSLSGIFMSIMIFWSLYLSMMYWAIIVRFVKIIVAVCSTNQMSITINMNRAILKLLSIFQKHISS